LHNIRGRTWFELTQPLVEAIAVDGVDLEALASIQDLLQLNHRRGCATGDGCFFGGEIIFSSNSSFSTR